MWTKSKIQLIKESLAMANDYREGLENLMDKYTIEDSVFMYKRNMAQEVTNGYFIEKSKHDTLLEAVRNCNCEFEKYGIRIINNKEFVVGEIKQKLSECCETDKVFDINQLIEVR